MFRDLNCSVTLEVVQTFCLAGVLQSRASLVETAGKPYNVSSEMGAISDPVREAVFASLQNDKRIATEQGDSTSPNDSQPAFELEAVSTETKSKSSSVTKKRKKIDSNWKKLKKSLEKNMPVSKRPRKRITPKPKPPTPTEQPSEDATKLSSFMKREAQETSDLTRVVAMDCEMVGVGPDGRQNALARVSVVNYLGDVLYDKFVKVHETVTDYRTQWSGVREEDVNPDSETAVEPYDAQKAVGEILKGRILVGHALKNDMRVLRLSHPWKDIRDTSVYYNKLWKRTRGRRSSRPPGLRAVVAQVLGVDTFQKSEHDSCEDSRAALALYKRNAKEWEQSIRSGNEAARTKAKSKAPLKISKAR